jgi:hypothetical protein
MLCGRGLGALRKMEAETRRRELLPAKLTGLRMEMAQNSAAVVAESVRRATAGRAQGVS